MNAQVAGKLPSVPSKKEKTMSTAVYVIGFIVLIAGLAWAATVLGVPSLWVTIGVVVVAGIAIIGIAGNLQTKETQEPREPRS